MFSRVSGALVYMSYTIEAIQPSDKEVWVPLWRKYLEFYETSLPDKQYESTFARLCDPDGDIYGLLIRDASGTAKGLCHYLFHSNAWTDKSHCYLNDLYVVAECRGKGYGRKLIEKTRDISRQKGCVRLYWTTAPDNVTARRLYDSVAITNRVVYKIDN